MTLNKEESDVFQRCSAVQEARGRLAYAQARPYPEDIRGELITAARARAQSNAVLLTAVVLGVDAKAASAKAGWVVESLFSAWEIGFAKEAQAHD